MKSDPSFGYLVRRFRKAADLTQEELARRVACSTAMIRRIEADERRPSKQLAALLAEQLGVPAEIRPAFAQAARGALSPVRLQPPAEPAPSPLPSPATSSSLSTLGSLPAPANPLIGRETQLETLRSLLRRGEVRLVTLTGLGGIGKTRLALEAATTLRDDFAEVAFVPLASVRDTKLVAATVAQTLGLEERGDQPLLETLKAAVRGRSLLLVLDNFEHVLAAARLITELLRAAPDLKVLVTSRTTLRLSPERELAVPPLALPASARLPCLNEMLDYEAVRLFVERAQAVCFDFALTSNNARAVLEICRRLDAIPLAIELAAARIKQFPPEALLARLGNRLNFLTRGYRDLPARQQTLRKTLDWSYDLLGVGEQRLLARLSVFAGGCRWDALMQVCVDEDGSTALVQDMLADLLDHNMIEQHATVSGEPRYVMLETIREYAYEKLEAMGEATAAHDTHAEYFLRLAEQAESELQGPKQSVWIHRLEGEHGNIREALGWYLKNEDGERALRLAGALWWFWWMRGYLREGRTWLTEALALPQKSQPAISRAKGLFVAAYLMWHQDDYDQARELLEESQAISQLLGDKRRSAYASWGLGCVAAALGVHDQAAVFYHKGLRLFREIGDMWGVATTLLWFGVGAASRGDYLEARHLYKEALAAWQAVADKRGMAAALNNLGEVARLLGDYDLAAEFYSQSRDLFGQVDHKWGKAALLLNLGHVANYQKNTKQAVGHFEEALGLYKELGSTQGMAEAVAGLGGVAAISRQPERAARLLGAAAALLDRIHAVLGSPDQAEFDRAVGLARTALDEEVFAAAFAAGHSLSLDAAIDYALDDRHRRDGLA